MSDSRRRRILWARDPHCHWCGRLTAYATPLLSVGVRVPPPNDLATVDHLDSRLSGRRGQTPGERTVLACYACNQNRGAAECRAYPDHSQRFIVARTVRPETQHSDLDIALTSC